MGYAFISYCSRNQAPADAMRALLTDKGIRTWMAPYDIPAGSKYAQVITQALKECGCLVLMLTQDSQDSIWVAKEVERAIHYKKAILPVQLEDVVLNDEFELYISTDQIVPVTRIDESTPEIRKLLSSIRSLVGQEAAEQTMPEQIVFDLQKVRTFASCGKESSVFKVKISDDRLQLDVNFEPTRLRPDIPDYAGAYFLKQPAVDIHRMGGIRFRACSPDGSITALRLELKPQGRSWMHEVFSFQLSTDMTEYRIATADFEFPKTLHCLEEVTFVVKPEDFADEEQLTGKLHIEALCIEV